MRFSSSENNNKAKDYSLTKSEKVKARTRSFKEFRANFFKSPALRKKFTEEEIFIKPNHFQPIKDHSQSTNVNIGIIGGGISGLSAAYYASKAFPYGKISLVRDSCDNCSWYSLKIQRPVEDG